VLVVGAAGDVLRWNWPTTTFSIIVERATPSRHPKMDYVNGRSMELLRRLQLAEEIRTQG
jgi:hypothetical protein